LCALCRACRSDAAVGKTLTLAGPKAYTVQEVIELCEKLSGNRGEADVTQVPIWLLRATRNILRGFQWAKDAADRLVGVLAPPMDGRQTDRQTDFFHVPFDEWLCR
jgi:hypothetical protein